MPQRILSISGLRGVIGDGLDPQFLTEFAMAFGTLSDGGTVVLSRDGRSTGEMVRHAVVAGLLATGCKVLDAGIATTPTCGVLVRHHNAAGGLQITASHNPVQWNGLKPFSRAGAVLNAAQGEELLRILNGKSCKLVGWEQLGTVEVLDNAAAPHIERVLSLVDVNAIRRRRFKVVLDCNHGSGGVATPQLLDALGCEVTVLGGTPDGRFEHVPDSPNQNKPDGSGPGTIVCEEDKILEQHVVSGIAYSRDEAKVSIRRVKDQPGVSASVFGPLAEADISVDMIVQNVSTDGSTANITFTVARKDLRKAIEVLNGVKDKIGFHELTHSADVAKVSVVGIGMRSHAGVAAKMFRSLADKGINIQAIATSEIKVSVLIDEAYTELAVRALHQAYGLEA